MPQVGAWRSFCLSRSAVPMSPTATNPARLQSKGERSAAYTLRQRPFSPLALPPRVQPPEKWWTIPATRASALTLGLATLLAVPLRFSLSTRVVVVAVRRCGLVVYLSLSSSSGDHHLSHSCLGTGMRFGTQNKFGHYRASSVHLASLIVSLIPVGVLVGAVSRYCHSWYRLFGHQQPWQILVLCVLVYTLQYHNTVDFVQDLRRKIHSW